MDNPTSNFTFLNATWAADGPPEDPAKGSFGMFRESPNVFARPSYSGYIGAPGAVFTYHLTRISYENGTKTEWWDMYKKWLGSKKVRVNTNDDERGRGCMINAMLFFIPEQLACWMCSR